MKNKFMILLLFFTCSCVSTKKVLFDRNIVYDNAIKGISKYATDVDKNDIQIYRTKDNWNAVIYLPDRVIEVLLDRDGNFLKIKE